MQMELSVDVNVTAMHDIVQALQESEQALEQAQREIDILRGMLEN